MSDSSYNLHTDILSYYAVLCRHMFLCKIMPASGAPAPAVPGGLPIFVNGVGGGGGSGGGGGVRVGRSASVGGSRCRFVNAASRCIQASRSSLGLKRLRFSPANSVYTDVQRTCLVLDSATTSTARLVNVGGRT